MAPPDRQEFKTNILLVEDNRIDARLTSQALQKVDDWEAIIHVVDDGDKAMRFLLQKDDYIGAPMPDLIVLDMNLPKHDGTEVLRFIRANETLKRLLVFIFSSSPVDYAEDRMRAAQVKADSYFEKPHALATYFSIAVEMKNTYQLATRVRSVNC